MEPRKHILKLSLPPPKPNLKTAKVEGLGGGLSSTFLPLWDSQGEGY